MIKKTIDDPYADREAQHYDNPIPSREFLLDYLKQFSTPLSHPQIAEALELDEDGTEAIRRRLKAMVRDGQLLNVRRNKYVLASQSDIVHGVIIGHRDGFGFVSPFDGGNDVFLPFRQMRKVLDGDEVKVQVVHVERSGKREGKIVEVVKHNTHTLVGRIEKSNNGFYIIPENQRITLRIRVDKQALQGAQQGQFVTANIVQQPSKHQDPEAAVTEVLGEHMAPGMETDVAIRSHNIPYEWPSDVLKASAALGDEPTNKDKKGRIDLRDLPLVTIDGEDAQDFDDAIYCCNKKSGGWRLYVAIADVSHYVMPGTALDNEARLRATSVYFPNRVIPMLPEELSNGLCSLKPNVDRLCMVCEMSISDKGKVTRYAFYEGIMHSHARLTYTQVAAMLDDDAPDIDLQKRYKTLLPHIKALLSMFNVLHTQRKKRGAIEFSSHETRIIFDEVKKIKDIVPVTRNVAHRIIEECMLCANVAAANFLEKHGINGLFRVHDGPRSERLENVRQYLAELGLNLGGGEDPEPSDYQDLMNTISERSDYFVIQTMLLRSMSQAVYQIENRGHFGLAYEAYAHFTSPIRRYPDLMVHRAIRQYIRDGKPSAHVKYADDPVASKQVYYPFSITELVAIAEHSSMAERRADDATRDVTAWLKCEYLQNHIGEKHPGIVTAVTSFGFFVELSHFYVEGLVHIKNLKDDFYFFDAASQRLIGERQRRVFQLGDSVEVSIVNVNLDDRKIDFELAEHIAAAPRTAKKRGSAASVRHRKSSKKHTASNTIDGAEKNKTNTKKKRKRKPSKKY